MSSTTRVEKRQGQTLIYDRGEMQPAVLLEGPPEVRPAIEALDTVLMQGRDQERRTETPISLVEANCSIHLNNQGRTPWT
jgi:hypothetical protein